MKSDVEIQKDVMDELRWVPSLNSTEIGVAAKAGVVTLSGQVDSFPKKIAAERAAKRVAGVKAVAEDIEVKLSPGSKKTDTELAAAILNALKWNTAIQEEDVKIKVEDGIVKIEGVVEWEYQRQALKRAIDYISGVRLVINLVTVKPKIRSANIQQQITSAFQRHASIDAKAITVEVSESEVVLKGKVRSFAEKEDAEDAAWAAPGVLKVVSKLEIEEPEYTFYE